MWIKSCKNHWSASMCCLHNAIAIQSLTAAVSFRFLFRFVQSGHKVHYGHCELLWGHVKRCWLAAMRTATGKRHPHQSSSSLLVITKSNHIRMIIISLKHSSTTYIRRFSVGLDRVWLDYTGPTSNNSTHTHNHMSKRAYETEISVMEFRWVEHGNAVSWFFAYWYSALAHLSPWLPGCIERNGKKAKYAFGWCAPFNASWW